MLPQLNTFTALRFWFNTLLRQQSRRLVLGGILAFSTTFSAMALLGLSGWFITATALTGIALAAGITVMLDLYLPGGGIRLFALTRTVSRYLERLYNHDTVLRQLALARVQLFQGIQALPRHFSRQQHDADWLSRLTAELDSLDSLYLRLLLPPLLLLSTVLLFFLILAIWLPITALVLFMGVLLMLWLSCRKQLLDNLTTGQQLGTMLNQARIDVLQVFSGLAELSCAALLQNRQRASLALADQFAALQQQLLQQQARCQLRLNILHSLVLVVLFTVLLYAWYQQWLGGPVVLLFITGWLALSELLQALPTQLAHAGKTCYAATRLAPLAQASRGTGSTLPPVQQLRLTVSAHPRIAITATQPLHLDWSKAQPWLLVTGQSGCGKSTLAQLLTGEQDASIGTLLLDEQPLEPTLLSVWQTQFVYLTQSNAILADTVRYNLLLGRADATDAQLWQVLELVELADWVSTLPRTLDSWLGDTGQQLSGGQARRLSLARLLLRSPELVILDEPFSALDAEMAQRIWQNILPWLNERKLLLLMHQRPAFWPATQMEYNIDVR